MYVVTTNDKTIKYWKMSEKKIKKAVFLNKTEKDVKFPKMEVVD